MFICGAASREKKTVRRAGGDEIYPYARIAPVRGDKRGGKNGTGWGSGAGRGGLPSRAFELRAFQQGRPMFCNASDKLLLEQYYAISQSAKVIMESTTLTDNTFVQSHSKINTLLIPLPPSTQKNYGPFTSFCHITRSNTSQSLLLQ